MHTHQITVVTGCGTFIWFCFESDLGIFSLSLFFFCLSQYLCKTSRSVFYCGFFAPREILMLFSAQLGGDRSSPLRASMPDNSSCVYHNKRDGVPRVSRTRKKICELREKEFCLAIRKRIHFLASPYDIQI